MIQYHVVKRRVIGGPDAGKELYYGQVRNGTRISFEKVCEEVADRSTATAGDAEAVLKAMLKVVAKQLLSGHIVELGRMGRFRLTAGSEGVQKAEEVTAHKIRTPRVRFFPGKRLREMLTKLSFVKPNMILETRPCDKEHLGE